MTDIVALIGERVRLKRAGSSWKGLCPFHGEKTPSFTVNDSRGKWHCFGCQASGDAIDFLQRIDGLTYKAALAAVGGEAYIRPVDDTPAAPVVDARPLLSGLWDLVVDTPWSPEATGYFDGRGIHSDAAWIVGCREWSYGRTFDRIAELLAEHAPEVQQAAGLLSPDGVLWYPVRARERGIAFPVWRMGEAYPWRWRWRSFAPRQGAPKCYSSYAAGACVDFLGASLPTRRGFGGIVSDDAYDVRAPRGSTLVVVEGEPDWLSAVEALDGSARSVAVCGSPVRWRDAWPSMASLRATGVEHILVCVHEGAADADGFGHGVRLAESIAVEAECAGITVRARLPDEGYDLNDMHKRGELREWLAEALSASPAVAA